MRNARGEGADDADGAHCANNAVVRSVLTACRTVDGAARVCHYTVTDGVTRLRLRPGAEQAAADLAARLTSVFPLASVGVHHNMLDGSVEADVTVPALSDERRAARRLAVRRPLSRLLLCACYLAVGAALLMVCRRT